MIYYINMMYYFTLSKYFFINFKLIKFIPNKYIQNLNNDIILYLIDIDRK